MDELHPDSKPSEPLLIYDGDCSFCRVWMEYGKSATGEAVSYEPYQKAASRFPEIPVERFKAAAQFVDPAGRISSGAQAVFRALSYAPRKRWLLTLYLHLPLFAALSEAGYRWVARRRGGLYWVTKVLWGRRVEPAKYALTRSVFLRSLGVIYLIAFASWWWQIPGLIGQQGLIPARDLLEHARGELGARAYFLFPTLAWLHPTERFVSGLALTGTLLSLLVVADVLAGPTLLLLWLLYLSQVTLGQEFMGFQWDSLLLEAGFLAIWLAAWPRRGPRRAPSPSMIWLLRWLLFREMFSSGMVKLLGGDPTWRNLTALTYHYETQPLPNVISWYMNQLPRWLQMGSAVVLFTVELLFPLLIFTTRRYRRAAAAAIASLQIVILLTGNYAYFNLLTIALCVPLLDDDYLLRLLPQRWRPDADTEPLRAFSDTVRLESPLRQRIALACLTVILLWSGAVLMILRFGGRFPGASYPSAGYSVVATLAGMHIVDSYGLFEQMTTERDEIVLEGSDDGGETWKAYEFPYKPGDPSRPPPWVAPYQPRLDWQMWFAALGNYRRNPWFVNLAVRLLEGSPGVLRLLETNPFPEHPPRVIRAVLYQYHFTTFAERRATGNWWTRAPLGLYLPEVSLQPEVGGGG